MKRLTFTTFYESPQWAIGLSCFDILREHHPGPIFPHLRELEFWEWETAPYAAMFIQPTLRHLLFYPNIPEHQIEVMESVQARAPELTSFVMDDEPDFLGEVEEPFNKTIRALKNLTNLSYTTIALHHDTLVHLSSIPHLYSLGVKLNESIGRPWTSPSWGAFRALSQLSIDLFVFEDVVLASFLESISSRAVRGLHIQYYGQAPPAASQLPRVFSAISRFVHLRSFALDFNNNIWAETTYDGSIIAPLLSLRFIKSFWLTSVPVKLSRQDLKRMMESWLLLEKLQLETLHARISLEDLVAFTHRATLLDSIHVELEPVASDWDWSVGEERARLSMASHLSLGRAHIDHDAAGNVAAFLARYFPLAEVTSSHSHYHTYTYRNQPRHSARVVEAIDKMKKEMVTAELVQVVTEVKTNVRRPGRLAGALSS